MKTPWIYKGRCCYRRIAACPERRCVSLNPSKLEKDITCTVCLLVQLPIALSETGRPLDDRPDIAVNNVNTTMLKPCS